MLNTDAEKKPSVELILQDPTRMKRSLITVCRKRFHCNQRWESIANKEISKNPQYCKIVISEAHFAYVCKKLRNAAQWWMPKS
ncbi:hypothetical protein [Bifidobacterium moukalabense]|uniref:hypothetical protein n=1 Tax=Bifidobacterium moukalabense TaxID=1333651 RepID=UPI001267A7E2|nr:hypothetical protein [Bifidobacterium moukalabense]